jgi:predicted transcriptional regulator
MDRKTIVTELVENNPGIRFNEIMRLSEIRNGTLSHYVKKLEEEERIILERTPRVTRLYPPGLSTNDSKICKYLTIETHRRLILYLLKKDVATATEIRGFLKKSPSVVSVNLNELFREKIIQKEYDIPSNKYSLKNPEQVKGVLGEYYPSLLDKITNNAIEMLDF